MEYYHLNEVCKLIPHKTAKKEGMVVKYIQDMFCETHQVTVCRCGWQWGKHYQKNG